MNYLKTAFNSKYSHQFLKLCSQNSNIQNQCIHSILIYLLILEVVSSFTFLICKSSQNYSNKNKFCSVFKDSYNSKSHFISKGSLIPLQRVNMFMQEGKRKRGEVESLQILNSILPFKALNIY